MICVYCFHKKTQVVNSRASKKDARIWRRRACMHCNRTFSTYELPEVQLHIQNGGILSEFSLGKLHLSIAKCFSHTTGDIGTSSLELAKTIQTLLLQQGGEISQKNLISLVHTTLKRYDSIAAIQYAAHHHLVTSTRRPGRPSTRYVD